MENELGSCICSHVKDTKRASKRKTEMVGRYVERSTQTGLIEQKKKEGEGEEVQLKPETQTDRMRLARGRERAAERPFPSFARSLLRQKVKLTLLQICNKPSPSS